MKRPSGWRRFPLGCEVPVSRKCAAGAWQFVHDQVQPLLAQTRRLLAYVGRPESAATAAGSHRRNEQEQAQVLSAAFAPLDGAERGRNVRVMPRR